MTKKRPTKRAKFNHHPPPQQKVVDFILVDFGTSKICMASGNANQEEFKMIGKYPNAQGCNTPSTVAQAPSTVLYKKFKNQPAQALGFGYILRRKRRDDEILVEAVKIPLLPDPDVYDCTYAAQVVTAEECLMESPKQFAKDFFKLAIEHALRQFDGRQPTKGWVFAAPQCYTILEVQRFRDMVVEAGCKGEIWINGESDCVAFANLDDISRATNKNNVAVGVVDIGAGTTVNHFRNISKVNWSPEEDDEEYPYQIGDGREKFVLKEEDMNHIMNPPIDEISRRIIAHLSNVKLDVVLLSGGTSELLPLRKSLEEMLKAEKVLTRDATIIHNPSYSTLVSRPNKKRNAVVHGLHVWITHQDLIKTKYAHVTLSRGTRVHGGVERIDIYYAIDPNKTDTNSLILDLLPIDICTPTPDAPTYRSGTRVWNFASHCTTLATLDLNTILTGVNIKDLEESVAGKRRLWVQLGFKVAMDIIVEVLWRHDGLKCTSSNNMEFTKECRIRIPDTVLMDEFRSPVQQGRTFDSTIRFDTLDDHLRRIEQQRAEKNLKQQTLMEMQAQKKALRAGESMPDHLIPTLILLQMLVIGYNGGSKVFGVLLAIYFIIKFIANQHLKEFSFSSLSFNCFHFSQCQRNPVIVESSKHLYTNKTRNNGKYFRFRNFLTGATREMRDGLL
ncbi:hypothetical protein CJF30_00011113 [Rutstroemia sp. NJR-2017a BBW]|nr:hypothetical protein CJF30_00011113 [Rutstroemia sp. NJR-2017a BBW]